MKIRLGVTILTFLCLTLGFSQNFSDDVLFTVDGDSVFASEFIRVYKKNLDLVQDESQKDVDNYLKLFVDYKLKLKEARRLELDKKSSYQRELSNYKRQLSKNYLVDNQVSEALITEAYARMLQEVNASHILIKIPESAAPEDTLRAYNEIVKLRDRVLNEGFENVKRKVHNGQTIFAENLGYFSAFKMIYKFETVAYNTPVGEVSQPFRTKFGFHIVKVLDKRPNRGQVEVGHIMIAKPKNNDSISQDPVQRINDIYKKLQQGENFESLAKQFSEDRSTAQKGGRLSPFSGGQLNSKEFEEASFALDVGESSKPVETDFGWHIIKLYKKIPVQPFDKIKGELEIQIKRDARSKLIDEAFAKKIRSKYNVIKNQEGLNYFKSIVTKDYYDGKWSTPENFEKDKVLNKVGNKTITYNDFAQYLNISQRKNREQKPLDQIVDQAYSDFLNKETLGYYEANLETENQDFANIYSEYKDGLLLFDLMESQIWNAAKEDTLGVKEFYNSNKQDYFMPKRVEALVASSNNEKVIKKVKTYLAEGWSKDQITKSMNTKGQVNVIFTSGMMDASHQALPKGFEFKEGVSDIYEHNNSFVVVDVKKVVPQEYLSFENARGRVISDFQNKLESDWLKRLHGTFQVIINKEVFNSVKAQIHN